MKSNFLLKSLLFTGLFFSFQLQTFSQVKGISYTFSPATEYIFSGNNSGMANSFAVGGQLGFGFGEYIQLNANYLKSLNTSTDFSSILNYTSPVSDKDISLSRFGGEFKANFSRKKVAPFISLGTGVQSLSTENTEKTSQIYLSSGAGFKIKIDDRINLAFEVVNTAYRLNAFNTLMTADERTLIGNNLIPENSHLISDLSGKARVSFFLGGKRPGTLSELDEAYLAQFSNGLKGLSIPVEPTFMRVNFNDKLPFTDAFYAGLSTGFDFGPYVGIRAFYLHALEEGAITNLGKSVIWGGETKFKLNSSEGMIPYLTVGGGRINVLDDYVGTNGILAENKAFASGGIGIEMPLTKRIKISGFATGLFTTAGDVNDLTQPEDLIASMSYGAKIGFSIGKKSESAQNILDNNIEKLKGEYSAAQEKEINSIVNEYELLLRNKETEIQQKEAEVLNKTALLDSLNAVQNKIKGVDDFSTSIEIGKDKSIIRVTPEELISIIREIKSPASVNMQAKVPFLDSLKNDSVSLIETIPADIKLMDTEKIENTPELKKLSTPVKDTILIKDTVFIKSVLPETNFNSDSIFDEVNLIQEKVGSITEKLNALDEVSTRNDQKIEDLRLVVNSQMEKTELMVKNLQLEIKGQELTNENLNKHLQDLSKLDENINDLSKKVKKMENKMDKPEKTVNNLEEPTTAQPILQVHKDSVDWQVNEKSVKKEGKINYHNSSVFAGINLGENSSFNLGLRWKYNISNSNFNLVPETYLGIGGSAYFGLFINSTYDFDFGSTKGFSPYIGTGVGILKTQNSADKDVFKGAYNIILGSQLPKVSNGRFYIDFTIRNLFKYNQLTLGYHLPF